MGVLEPATLESGAQTLPLHHKALVNNKPCADEIYTNEKLGWGGDVNVYQ